MSNVIGPYLAFQLQSLSYRREDASLNTFRKYFHCNRPGDPINFEFMNLSLVLDSQIDFIVTLINYLVLSVLSIILVSSFAFPNSFRTS